MPPLRNRFAPLFLVLALTSCDRGGGGDREARTLAVVQSWVEPVDASSWERSAPERPVAIYADRSGSMRGYLDPAYPTQTDYRSVIDGLQARLSPERIYGFGNRVRLEPNAGLDVLGDRAFYTDGNTELEQVVDTIAADSALQWNHLIIGDARRTDPNLAHRQFVRMRELGLRWTAAGGTFIVAVSRAPFTPVPGDPSGCHPPERGTSGAGTARTCPLYAFAFAAPGDGMALARSLGGLFEHLWAYPLPTAPAASLRISEAGPAEGTSFDPHWLPDGGSAAVPMISAETRATEPVVLRLEPTGASAPVLGTLLGSERTRAELWARPVSADEQPPAWRRRDPDAGAVRVSEDGREVRVFSPGGDDCLAAAPSEPCGTLYRLELRPGGSPAWLSDFEAKDAADRERTFGLGRLFESFVAQAPSAQPAARVYMLVR